MTLLRSFLTGLALLLLASGCAPSDKDKTVYVAVAANFKPALDVLLEEFGEAEDYEVIVSTGSTGSLFTQILQGAPYDIFLAADQARPEALEAGHPELVAERMTYATGTLVLWAPDEEPLTAESLAASQLRHIAIANPDLAPYGRAAKEVIEALGLTDQSQEKLVSAENVGQAFVFAETRNADLGFVALSQVLARADNARGAYWIPDQSLYAPVRQDAVLLRKRADNATVASFWAYLKSEEVQTRISELGYKRN